SAAEARVGDAPIVVAQAPHGMAPETPMPTQAEARMQMRFPQKVRVGDLIGLPVLDDDDVTLGRVRQVVRTPQGKIELIVSYSRWFGWGGHPVAVPIEVVAILARQIAAVDMPREEFAAAQTWTPGGDQPIPADDVIRIALTRR
ncbi:MAG TPA: PRC-barrel domain-containing protein, partial [Xanthobacteraceae bacterium]